MRQSGILMHLSSLPSPYGIGTMGREAYEFIDFLKAAGQTCWQLLPINPTGYGDSPYQGMSTFAGNPYLIDLDILVQEGLLEQSDIDAYEWGNDPEKVNFGIMFEHRLDVLYSAFRRFEQNNNLAYSQFVESESWWLDDFALFMALKQSNNFAPWYEWEDGLKLRKPEAIEKAIKTYKTKIEFHKFLQYEFSKQWMSLRAYAKKNGITMIGDVPIYVPLDSSDVWSKPSNYQLDEDLNPIKVAGCPPDAFAVTGQRWGNPIYRWDVMAEDDFAWWIKRLRKSGEFFDVVRIDHFRGLESYWSIPAEDETAENGVWVKGPGMGLIKAIHKELPNVNFIAEDLGFLTPEVKDLQKASKFPGMKILEFGFEATEKNEYTPDAFTTDCVCYTGTHDNETLLQWSERIDPKCIKFAKKYLKMKKDDDLCKSIIKAGMASIADLFVVQMQDYLGIGAKGRMNTPSTLSPDNWVWRMAPGAASDDLAKELYSLTKKYKRV